MQGELRSKKDGDGLGEVWCLDEIAMEKKQSLSCCADCSSKFEKEARDLVKRVDDDDESCPTSSNLPAWLQQYKDENRRLTSNDPDCHQVRELSKKWNSICNSIHKQQSSRERSMAFSSLSQSSSLSSYGQFYHNWTSPNQHWRNHNQLWISSKESSTDLREENGEPTAAPILSLSTSTNPANANPNPNSSSSTETMDTDSHKAKQLNAETLKTLYDGLEKRVPWQKHIMKEIAITVLECRSRLTKRSTPSSRERKQDMWLLFKGSDSQSKEKIARELATLIFGSESSFLSISPSFPAMERGKRSREEPCFVHLERFSEAITENPHRVIFMPGFEQSDHYFQMGLKRVLERGKVIDSNGQETSICDAIIVLGCESLERESRDFSALTRQRSESSVEMNEKAMDILSLDLNICAEDEDRTCDLELAKFVDGCFVLDVEGGRSEN
ncbi:hypothetical protein AMTR_s00030p00222340 [Amborella trichopoda]|uniref:Uncharacterized protein n=2 Tax=Amborella trichopoda TaxID=13333 RepID=U5D1P7_AMBTC|nr:hypothetical protein AMTR_s00030p00222340 [Amborella trichopoda]